MDTLERLRKVVGPYLPDPTTPIEMETNLFTGAGLNSLELVQLICDMEDEFQLKTEIPDDMIPKLHVVKDLVGYLEREGE